MSNINRTDKFDAAVCTHLFSWTPIIIGGLVALGLGFLLDLFAKGIGLSLYTNDPSGATALAVGGFLALAIGSFATMFTAGFAAGFFAGPTCGRRNFGVAYGFVAWCLGLLLMGLLASNMVSNTYFDAKVSTPTASEVATTAQNVTTRLHPATDASDTRAEKNVRATGMVSLAAFFIFFIGALAACFGGYYGFYYWDKWVERTY